MERTSRTLNSATVLLGAMHLAGLAGLHLEASRPLFQALIPFNLILSALILGWFHRKWTQPFILFAFGTFWAGYAIEVIGVSTGAIFGAYRYGDNMGWVLGGAPPLIGLQWLVVVYCSAILAQSWFKRWYAWVTAGAAVTTCLDALIEPMAVSQNMWTWFGQEPPMQNYLAWFVISWIMLAILAAIREPVSNPLARRYLLIQFAFFIGFRVIAWAI